MKYLYLIFALFLVSCRDNIVYRGVGCEVYPNDTGYTNEMMRTTKEIRENVLATYSQKGVVHTRNDNEDMDDEIEAMSNLIESQTEQARRLLEQKYCKEVDLYYNQTRQDHFSTKDIKDTLYLNYLNQIKHQYLQEQGM